MRRKDGVIVASPFRSCESYRVTISVARATGSISMVLLNPTDRQRLLTNPAKVPMLTPSRKEENLLMMADAGAFINFSEEAK